MKYCKYCGKQLEDGELCDCEDAIAERKEKIKTSQVSDPKNEDEFKSYSEEEDLSSERYDKGNMGEENTSPKDDTVTINIDVNSFKNVLDNGIKAFRRPYSYGKSYLNSLDYKNSAIVMLISSLVTAIFALIVCAKLNASVNRGLMGLEGLFDSYVPSYGYNAISLGKAFFLSIIYSLIVSLLLAVAYFLSYKIFKVKINFEQAMAFASLRASYTIPIKLVAAILSIIMMPLGVLVFFMSSLLASSLISASIFSKTGINNDRTAKAGIIVRFIFVIVFFEVARRGAPNLLSSDLVNGFKDMIRSIAYGGY